MNAFDKLVKEFEKFPGVGVRQARRFAFYITTMSENETSYLSELLKQIKEETTNCNSCFCIFSKNTTSDAICSICSSNNRNHQRLLIVEKDSDITAVEKSGIYDGLYFVLGGTAPLLNKENVKKLRTGALKEVISKKSQNEKLEIIMGFSVNPDGENTARFVENIISKLNNPNIKVTHLGRGLSFGSELEYADPDTIKNAIKNRS